MRKSLIIIVLVGFVFMSGCGFFTTCQYDAKTVQNLEKLKDTYVKDVAKAKDGKLHDLLYKSAIKLFDSSIAREKAKEGK